MSDKRANSDRRREGSPARGRSLEKSPGTRVRSSRRTSTSARPQREKLRTRLKTAEETLAAIQSGEVDALMVLGRRGEQVVTLKGGEPAYRMLVEAMSEGAATAQAIDEVGRLARGLHPHGAGRPWLGCCAEPIRFRVCKDPQ